MLDAELSIMTRSADKIIRVDGAPGGPYLAVVEFQSYADNRLDDRIHLYSAMARWNYDLPVRCAVYQLSRTARSRGATGVVTGPGLTFAYDMVPVWSLPVADLLKGPIGTVPLAPLVDQSMDDLRTTVDRVWHRLKTEVSNDRLGDVVTQTAVLIGVRYDQAIAERWNSRASTRRSSGRGSTRGSSKGARKAARRDVSRARGTRCSVWPPRGSARRPRRLAHV
jgi:hypothetical protein